MKQTQIIASFLFPTYQNPSETVEPAMGAFHFPTPGPVVRNNLSLGFFFATRTNMFGVAQFPKQLVNPARIVSFIQTQMLHLFGARLRPLYGGFAQGRFQQDQIVPISALDGYCYRQAVSFYQY